VAQGPATQPPATGEDLNEAERRIAAVIASGDCDKIDGLYVLGTEQIGTLPCQTLRDLGSFRRSGAQVYGRQAAVVDYTKPGQVASMVLVRDWDGLFHVGFVAGEEPATTVDTALDRSAEGTATAAINVLRRSGCRAFLRFTNRAGGVGTLNDPSACQIFAADPLQSAVFDDPAARPVLVGGNGRFAFFSIRTPTVYLISVFAKSEGTSAIAHSLRAGPDEYAYTGSYVTNNQLGRAPG